MGRTHANRQVAGGMPAATSSMACRRPDGGKAAERHHQAWGRVRRYAARTTTDGDELHHLPASRSARRWLVAGHRRFCFYWAWSWSRYCCRTSRRRSCETGRSRRFCQRKESSVAMSDDKAPSSIRTIVISNLEPCMDEQFLYNCLATTGEVTGIVLQRDETTNAPNTAFVEFSTQAYAKAAKDYTNGKPRPDHKGFLFLEMQWASTNLDRTYRGPHVVTYKSDESSDSDTASTLESQSQSSD